MRSWGAAGLAVAMVLGAGCSSGSSKADPPAESSTSVSTPKPTVRVTTTTKSKTPPPPYSFDNSVPPPELVNTGAARVEVLSSMLEYSAWLTAHNPDPALAALLTATGSRGRERLISNLTSLQQGNSRAYEVKTGPDEISIVSRGKDSFTARVVQLITAQRIVDRAGRVTSERPLDGRVEYIALVARQEDAWRLAALDEQRS